MLELNGRLPESIITACWYITHRYIATAAIKTARKGIKTVKKKWNMLQSQEEKGAAC